MHGEHQGPRLVRRSGNDEELAAAAVEAALGETLQYILTEDQSSGARKGSWVSTAGSEASTISLPPSISRWAVNEPSARSRSVSTAVWRAAVC